LLCFDGICISLHGLQVTHTHAHAQMF